MGPSGLILPVAGAVAGGIGATVWAIYTRFRVTVPPDRAAVLYGRMGAGYRGQPRGNPQSAEISRPRIVVGGRAFIAPWDHGVGYLSLHPVTVDLPVRSLNSVSGSRASGWEARISLQAKIPSDPELLAKAAENLLGKSEEEIRVLVRHTVEGAVPAVLARLRSGDNEPDWDHLASEVQASVAPDLVGYGLVVRTLSITQLTRIAPSEGGAPAPPAPVAPARPATTAPADAARSAPDRDSSQLDDRLSRVERSLGIMGAEIVRIVHESPPSREGNDAASALDIPLGFEGAGGAALPESGDASVHDSIGDDRSPRSRLPSREGVTGEEGGRRRPLLDVEKER